MRLKKLEIQGFKSFPNKVTIEFKNGITTVVGPNGSGKSNITDAVRWVLGEQNAKTLRGGKMEDIIFSGTQLRKSLGFAEVSLYLENEDQALKLDYTEVKITRKLYRSGESEYYINNHHSRLKDIHELFMDTGVGKEGYSIIGQGKIDEILSSRSEERRNIFEEAAGIVKFKARKNEAEKKLKKERENLVRVEDIINELNSQLEPLAVQSDEAKQFLKLKEQLKQFEINIFIHRVKEIEEILQQYTAALTKQHNELQHLTHRRTVSNEQLHSAKVKQQELNEGYDSLQNQIFTHKNNIEKYEGEYKVLQQKLLHTAEDSERISKELVMLQSKQDKTDGKLNILQAKWNGVMLQIKAKAAELQEKNSKYSRSTQDIQTSETFIENQKADIIEKLNYISELKANLHRYQIHLEQYQQRQEALNKEKKDLSIQKQNLELLQDELHNKLQQRTIEAQELTNCIKKIQIQIESLEKKLQSDTESLQELHKQNSAQQSRKKLLEEMENDFEGYHKTVKNILQNTKQGHTEFVGVCGTIAEIIQVPKGLENAVEAALGGSIQNIVTETEYDAKRVIEYIKKKHLGRATFLPISAIKGKSFITSEKQEILKNPGVQGISSELVQYDSKYKNIIESLLGRVVVVQSLDIGIALAKKHGYTFKIVTLDGNVIHAGGSMTGGSLHNKTTSLFSRKSEIIDLHQQIEKTQTTISQLQQDIQHTKKQLHLQKESYSENNQEMYNKNIEIQKLENELSSCLKEIQAILDKSNLLNAEAQQLTELLNKNHIDNIEQSSKVTKLEQEVQQLHKQVEHLQQDFLQGRKDKDALYEAISKCKIELSTLEQEKNYVSKSIEDNQQELDAVVQEYAEKHKQIEQLHQDKQQYVFKSEKIKKNVELEHQEAVKCQALIQTISEQRAAIQNLIAQKEQELDKVTVQISELQQQVYSLENKKNKLEVEEQALFDRMWEEYELTYQTALEFHKPNGSIADLQRETLQVRNELKKMEHVNVNAIEEYKRVKERYEFLTHQRDDIIKAEEALLGIIDELIELMKRQFTQYFAAIGIQFNEVFKELFGGGHAQLRLTDEEDVLNSGIEIHVQPPGKRLQNLSLLSGGERALTAIAILFSILKVKPTPFCVLDEIEAALDDSNVNRYAQYLKVFSQHTQFIIITHRKGTMEVADALYGVTMQEHGISTILSVSLADSENIV